jgi:CDP-glucose 4,6-dehydratase
VEDMGVSAMSKGKISAFDPVFWTGKRVWVSGHTGFKGAWLCVWLAKMGAKVMGTSLGAPARESLAWEQARSGLVAGGLIDHRADIQNEAALAEALRFFKPEIAFHLAAQAIVLDSYKDMAGTWGPNLMGTLSSLQACADAGAKAIVAVTSDKCYKNKGWEWGYRESDELGGSDPYSASKAACEILVESWRASRGRSEGIALGSARAGNVIGGGDNAPWRILPEMLAAFGQGLPGQVRNPSSTRPFQHVLEPLSGYMLMGRRLWEQAQGAESFDEAFNFGPGPDGEKSAGWLADAAASAWGEGVKVSKGQGEQGGKEARVLMLDSSKAAKRLGWHPTWDAKTAVEKSVEWEKARLAGSASQSMQNQIEQFEANTKAMLMARS